MPTEQYSNVQQILCKRLLLSLHPKIYLEGVCSSYFVARMSPPDVRNRHRHPTSPHDEAVKRAGGHQVARTV
jgi:hypothetical protein